MVMAKSQLVVSFQTISPDELPLTFIVYDSLTGQEVNRYVQGPDLTGPLACYVDGQFLFLSVRDGKRLLVKAQPE